MAKSKAKLGQTPRTKRKSAPSLPDTSSLASKIRKIDLDLVNLLQDRARLVIEATDTGDSSALSLLDEDTLRRLVIEMDGPLPERSIRAILREVAGGCRALVHEPRIAILGPEFSYSHLAAIHRFGQSVEFVPVATIAAVFEEVHRRQADFGLVPMENSTDGRVADTLDMFTKMRVRICDAIELRIHHTLLGKCSRSDIREVYSKPQALSQCRNWLAKHVPAARLIEVTSTSTAAQLAGEKRGAAAIASLQAGVQHGLNVLAEHIEDNPDNTTRFAVIGDHVPPPTGNDHTAMLFQIAHEAGSLADVLAAFKRNHVNLTWIDSFPIPKSNRGYLFFVEMEGHENDANVQRALATLEKTTFRLEVLGSFPATTPVD